MRQAIRLSASLALLAADRHPGGRRGSEGWGEHARGGRVLREERAPGPGRELPEMPRLVEAVCGPAARLAAGDARGGDNGPVLVPGDPDQSPLIQAVRHEGDVKMPPKGGKLPEPAARALADWVKMGAPWPADSEPASDDSKAGAAADHWAFQPVRAVEPPAVDDRAWVASPIDAFILARLEAKGLAPSPPADRRTLIRRVTFDLTGLPPTAEEVEAFAERRRARRLREGRSTGCWPRRATASAGAGTGSTWPATPTPRATSSSEERRYPFAYTYRDYVDPRLQRRPALRPVPHRAARRRPARRRGRHPAAGRAGLPDGRPAVPEQHARHHRRPDRRRDARPARA